MTYKAVCNMNEVGVYFTLYEAIKDLWEAVKGGLAQKVISWQTLETACWVEEDGHYLFKDCDLRKNCTLSFVAKCLRCEESICTATLSS